MQKSWKKVFNINFELMVSFILKLCLNISFSSKVGLHPDNRPISTRSINEIEPLKRVCFYHLSHFFKFGLELVVINYLAQNVKTE